MFWNGNDWIFLQLLSFLVEWSRLWAKFFLSIWYIDRIIIILIDLLKSRLRWWTNRPVDWYFLFAFFSSVRSIESLPLFFFFFSLWKKSVECVITIFDLWQPLSFFPIDNNTHLEKKHDWQDWIFLKYYLNSVNMLRAVTNWSIVSIYQTKIERSFFFFFFLEIKIALLQANDVSSITRYSCFMSINHCAIFHSSTP